ncbi:MAG: hypothetical protein HC799_18060 [Limnothrix sp. RL_2_0]|nr:hypothetical protein [Limnothrix sp. RL_2_0]
MNFIVNQGKQGMGYFGRSPLLLSCLFLLVACDPSTTDNGTSNQTTEGNPDQVAVNCPTTDVDASRFNPNQKPYIDEIFNFAAREIRDTTDTLTFHTPNHDLVFCKANNTWAILPPSEAEPLEATNEDILAELSNPDFESIQANGQAYQYRAILDPNPYPDYEPTPQKVIFELIPAGETEPIRIDLYTLDKLRETGIGYELGLPEVRGAVQVEDQLFLAVSSEQGEGFSGLTTLVRYDLADNTLAKIQPQNIIREQITTISVTSEADQVVLWMGTKYSAEGSGRIPAKGLVTYSFSQDAWQDGKMAAYSVNNSPLVGAVPSQLYRTDEMMWVATGSGICRFPWQQVKEWEAWQCWRFALEADFAPAGVPLFSSVLASVPSTTLSATEADSKIEVLWWSSVVPMGFESNAEEKGRYEVAYQTPRQITVKEGGYRWADQDNRAVAPWDYQVYWPGHEWHWQGNRFARDFDEVDVNLIALGASGISERGYNRDGIQDTNVMRGDIRLLSLTTDETQIEYFSGWIDDGLLEPYFVMLPSTKQPIETPNPLKAIAPNLPSL